MNGMNTLLLRSLLPVIVPLLSMLQASAAELGQPLRADGMELFYGVMPAAIIRGHPNEHSERKMHGGVPRGSGQHHLIVSLFNVKTSQRIEDATVTASVSEAGLTPQRKPLDTMELAGTRTYGNYFSMSGPGPYRIEVDIRRHGDAKPAKAVITYSHPRR